MREFFLFFFAPQWNRLLVIGGILTILGVITIPILIGIPIAGIGFSMFAIGTLVSFARLFPGGKEIVNEFEAMFKRMFTWLKIILQDAVK
jgi:hypothetical protein